MTKKSDSSDKNKSLGSVQNRRGDGESVSGRFRQVSNSALQNTRLAGRGAGNFVMGAVSGAIQAVNEVGEEAGDFVKDAVFIVIEGSGDAAKATTPVVRNAVEGAMRGAASVGVSTESAVEQASQGVVEAVQAAGGSLEDAAKATVSGVISGVAATGGNVQKAASDTARELIDTTAEVGGDVADVALSVVEGAIEASENAGAEAAETVTAVASGAIEAAYEIDEGVGDAVRTQLISSTILPIGALAPAIQERYDDTVQRVSANLDRRQGGWRFRALWSAGKLMFTLGGIDMSASLAYYTLLSFFPLIALTVLVFAIFAGTDTVRQYLSDILSFYFPASQDFVNAAITHIFSARLEIGIISVIAILIGVNGLFMAANRAINRIFGSRPKRMVGATAMQVLLAVAVVLIFIAALSLTLVFQVVVSFSESFPRLGPITTVLIFAMGILSAILPFILTALVFTIVYQTIPNRKVSWKDATFAGIVAVILFEAAKNLFFWFTALSSQRSLLYGAISSIIILLIWSNVAGLVFLYGAALTKEAGRLRPKTTLANSES